MLANLPAAELAERILRSPDLYLIFADIPANTGVLAELNKETYQRASFLSPSMETPSEERLNINLPALATLLGAARPRIDYLFHIGHCGSSLLSRALGEFDSHFSLRETVPLLHLSQYLRNYMPYTGCDDETRLKAVLDVVLKMIGRRYRNSEVSLLKPASHCNALMPDLLDWHVDSRAIFLKLDLEVFIASMLAPKNQRELEITAQEVSKDLVRQLEWPELAGQLQEVPMAQSAAAMWLSQMLNLSAAQQDRQRSSRILVLDFDDFLSQTEETLADTHEFLCGQRDADVVAAIMSSELFGRYSKDLSQNYSPRLRSETLNQARDQHKNDIHMARAWLQELARNNKMIAELMREHEK